MSNELYYAAHKNKESKMGKRVTEMTHDELIESRKLANEKFKSDLENRSCISGTLSSHIKSLPSSMQKLFYDVFIGKLSYPRAVKAKCLDCSCYQRDEITKCTVETYPLYRLRPYQSKPKDEV